MIGRGALAGLDLHFIRHLVATVAYRTTKVIENVPPDYPTFSIGEGVRTPIETLHHISNVLEMANAAFQEGSSTVVEMQSWEAEVARFYDVLKRLDEALAMDAKPRTMSWEQIVQGPLADALTHVGQLATLRRLAGNPVARESYIRANVTVGQIGPMTSPKTD